MTRSKEGHSHSFRNLDLTVIFLCICVWGVGVTILLGTSANFDVFPKINILISSCASK